jgi:hypothetical protein
MTSREKRLANCINGIWLAGYSYVELDAALRKSAFLTDEERMKARIIFLANEMDMRVASSTVINRGAQWDRRLSA